MEYKIGMIVKGKVTGIQAYGIFVTLDEETQGLIHISELQHGFVQKIEDIIKVGDYLDVMVLDVDEYTKSISLSTRAMIEPEVQKKRHSRRKKPRYGGMKGIGFRSLEKKLPFWIEEAKMNERELHS